MLGLGISEHMKNACSSVLCGNGAVLYKRSTNPLTPALRLDKESIQLGASVRALKDCGESFDLARYFCNEYSAVDYLLKRQLDGIWIRQQGFAVMWVAERGPPLQGFEWLTL